MILILSLIAVILFVFGITLIFKSYCNVPEADRMVFKEDFDKVKDDLGGLKEHEDKLKLQMDSLSSELEKDKEKFAQAQKSGEAIDGLKAQEAESKVKIEDLEKNLGLLHGKTDTQAKEFTTAMTAEFDKEKNTLQDQIKENIGRIQQLERELESARGGSVERLNAANETVDNLTAENQRLTQGLRQIITKISEVKGDAFAVKQAGDKELMEAHQAVERLQSELATLQAQIKDNESKAGPPRHGQGEAPPQAGMAEAGARKESAEEIRSIKERNARLVEKEEQLQFEIAKGRTQVTGLEEICKELNAQLEQMRSDEKGTADGAAAARDDDIKRLEAQLEHMRSEQQEFIQAKAQLKAVEADCLWLEKTLGEQKQYAHDIKQCMEENKMKIRLLDEKTKEGAELIAQFAAGKEFEEFRKSIHLDEITRHFEDEIKALRIKNMEFEKELKTAGTPTNLP